jgi:hypothetical protein
MRPGTRWMIVSAAAMSLALTAAAQQHHIFDVNDFVDPRERAGALFISRLIGGVDKSFIDGYRPLRQGVGFLHIANSFYLSRFEFDYKHSETFSKHDPSDLIACACNPIMYFPTPPPRDATPEPPPGGRQDMLQIGWYQRAPRVDSNAMMWRYRLSWSRQVFTRNVRSAATNDVVKRLSGREKTFGFNVDLSLPFRGREIFSTLSYMRTKQDGPIEHRAQNEWTYTSRFPGVVTKWILFSGRLTVGSISDRAGTAINLVNPKVEASWYHFGTKTTIHLVYSPQFLNSGLEGWRTTHEIALFADRALFVKLFH